MAFNIPVVFFDSVYINYGKYYPKVLFEKFIYNFFGKMKQILVFVALEVATVI